MRMVQRKLVDKLGIQPDCVETNQRCSPPQSQDSKNMKGAADSKNTMEGSRSIQHSDFKSLRSKDIAQPGKASTCDHVRTRAATPQRRSPEQSPNYMKFTSSFEARRGSSRVGSRTPQNSMMDRNLSPVKSNNSRHNSGSDHKPVGAVAKTSSFKVVRSLMKTPSFKPSRASMNKISPIALCEDFDVQKPTCASTLKDLKMPVFLELSAGATEAEGTSAMKVCPYIYCSLNGHHHAPLPPLKSFLSAKRRVLKAQKVIKLGCLSPHRAKPSPERMVKIDAKQVILAEIPQTKGMKFDSRPLTPLMHINQTDFSVEINRNNRDDDTAKGKIPESLENTVPGFVIDIEAEKDQNIEAGAKMHPFPRTREDDILDCLRTKCNTGEESQQITQYGQSDSKASEELKEEHHSEPSVDDVSNLKLKVSDIYNGSNIESISNSYSNSYNSHEDILTDEVQVGLYDDKSVSSGAWSDDGDSDFNGSYHNMDLESPCFACNKQFRGKIYSTCDENHESIETQVRENSISHPIEEFQATSVGKHKVPEASTCEKDENCSESVETRVNENLISHPMEEFQATIVEKSKVAEASDEILRMNFQLGADGIKCTSDVEEVVFGLQGDEADKQEHVSWLLYQDFIEQDQDETPKNYNANFNSMEVFELDTTVERRSSDYVLHESFIAKTEYEDADQEDNEEYNSTTDARDGMEEKESLAAESFNGIRTFDSLKENKLEKPATEDMERKEELLAGQHLDESQRLELLQDFLECIAVNKNQSKQTDVTIVSETNQCDTDKTPSYESNGVENHEYPEINPDQLQTYEYKSYKILEDQVNSGPAVLKAAPNQNQEGTGEGENITEPDATETSITVKASAITQIRDHVSNANRTANEELTQIAKHLSWTTGSRKTVAELEDIRDFNPREPNYLPEEPEIEPEKVDLRHQLMDERKNSEEWMVDYALRQAVTKLTPARSRKVLLLVEAFEKVLPTPIHETHPTHTSSAFIHSRTIQTCR